MSNMLNAENVCDMLVLADRHNARALRTNAMSLIVCNPAVMLTDRWRALCVSDPHKPLVEVRKEINYTYIT